MTRLRTSSGPRRRPAPELPARADILSQEERLELDDLMYEAGYDETGKLRPSHEIAARMHELLTDALQAHREWAQYVLDDDVHAGHLARHKQWRARKEFVSTQFGDFITKKPAAMSIKRMSADSGETVWQPTFWRDMTKAELVQIVNSAQTRARSEMVSVSIAQRLIALLDETGAESVSEALEFVGMTIDQFLLKAA